MVGEMRDPETISTVITAAETGHLVFSTLHTNSTPQTVDRILDTFPPDQQTQVRAQLAQVLKGVVSMKLVRRRDGTGRIAALEILRTSPDVAKSHREGRDRGAARGDRVLGRLLPHAVDEPVAAGAAGPRDDHLPRGDAPLDRSRRPRSKLRKMFPKLREQETEMSSTADFSEILELQQYRKLYEEQEEKIKIRLAEKDEQIADLRQRLTRQGEDAERLRRAVSDADERMARAEAERERVSLEAKQRVDKLQDRVRS